MIIIGMVQFYQNIKLELRKRERERENKINIFYRSGTLITVDLHGMSVDVVV